MVGDAARLRQVLLNLAGNAIKFTERGGVAIIVEPGVWPGEIDILVRDTGIGIAPDEHDRIFQEFEQADGGIARKFGGTGLGLAISRRIVERMGGRIAVESMPGAGSTFRVTLPLTPAAGTHDAPLVAARTRRHGRHDRRGIDGRELADGAPADALGRARLRRARRDSRRRIAARARLGRDIRRSCDRPRRLRRACAGHRGGAAAVRAGHASRARRTARAEGSRLHRLSGQAGPRGFARGADGEQRRRIRAPRRQHRGGCRGGAEGRRAKGLAILVAEDNEINALLARSLLTRLGHRPTVATSGDAAVDAWLSAREAGEPYAIVLMDVHMPGSDGIEATRRIREAEAGGPRTPIVALTANAFDEDRDACLAAGMDGFLTKPLDRERLATALATAADAKAMAA